MVAGRPIFSSTRLVAELSEYAIISRMASRSVNVAPGENCVERMPLPGVLSSSSNVTDIRQVDLSRGRLAVGLDHDRQLDEAGRRHGLVGPMSEQVARREMLYRDRHFAFVRRDQRLQALGKGLGGGELRKEREDRQGDGCQAHAECSVQWGRRSPALKSGLICMAGGDACPTSGVFAGGVDAGHGNGVAAVGVGLERGGAVDDELIDGRGRTRARS